MISFPNAKINIGLFVTEKRADGYHNIETIFYPIPLQDALEIIPAIKTSIETVGLPISGNATDNLIWKAYALLQNDFPDIIRPLAIHLLKHIPMGAGMGGGSADGAFMLSLLNQYFELGLSKDNLATYALQLGSDCPFFIYNEPCYASGRGELLQPLPIDLSGYSLQIICPEVHISTAAAFSHIKPKPASFKLKNISELPVEEWKNNIYNDFELPIFKMQPVLETIKEQLYAQDAVYASMSGSGATLYGIFPKHQKANITVDIPYTAFYYE
jgi:4-diphosphocytidyl-2-C-methyl-D-erythritol kinase